MVTARRPAAAAAPLPCPTVLLTGFDAFGGTQLNPSWLAVHALHGRRVSGHRVIAAQLPTVFGESLRVLHDLLLEHRPSLVICVGQAGGRGAVSLERVALNVEDARLADNAAAQPVDRPVVSGGPTAYFTTLPIKAMLLALEHEGVAAEVSQTAGTFVCNHVFYGLMHTLATQRGFRHTRGGFIHLPYLPEQGNPSMSQDDMVRGLRAAIRCALKTTRDSAHGAGSLH